MLVHTSSKIAEQSPIHRLVQQRFREIRDEWRYNRRGGIRDLLEELWKNDFVPTSTSIGTPLHTFDELERFIGSFLDSVSVREVNSERGEVLDYEREPNLKAIAIGGNKLSRGLTLEGLLVSYFARRSPQYDTLLQMGRWYGYRAGYEDLTRVYTTGTLAGWFMDLALVESRIREDLQVYENTPGLRPYDLGMRILQHPAMQVTSALKSRFTSATQISQSYSASLEQTFKFPLKTPTRRDLLCERNRLLCSEFVKGLEAPAKATAFGPLWTGIRASRVIEFLRRFDVDDDASGTCPELMAEWIERQNARGDVVAWSVAIRGRDEKNPTLGAPNWLPTNAGLVWGIARTRIAGSNSLGVITAPGDEELDLSEEELQKANLSLSRGDVTDRNVAARLARASVRGLLLLYPISKYSGHDGSKLGHTREPLYPDPESGLARDLIGLAVSFPKTRVAGPSEAYLEGTSRWRPQP